MGRKKAEYNEKQGKRLNAWLQEIGITQSELAGSVHYSQQQISKIITGKANLTADLAKQISNVVTLKESNSDGELIEKKISPAYLLGISDQKYEGDSIETVSLHCLECSGDDYNSADRIDAALGCAEDLIRYRGYRIYEFTKTDIKNDKEVSEKMIRLANIDGNSISITPQEYRVMLWHIFEQAQKEVLFIFDSKKKAGT